MSNSVQIHRPKRGTNVKITKIPGLPRVRKTANGYVVEFTASNPTLVRYRRKVLTKPK